MTGATAEYRWPILAMERSNGYGLDAYLFTDIGQVFGSFDEIAGANLTTSLGGGIRLAAYGAFLGRFEVGWSEEQTVLRLRADQVFQFSKHGLYHGRNPIPTR